MPTGQYRFYIGNAITFVDDPDLQRLRRTGNDAVFNPPAARVLKSVTHDFRNGGGDAVLVLGIETHQGRDHARALAGEEDIRIFANNDREYALGHDTDRITATVASSRPRRKSRNIKPAITLGWATKRPGYLAKSQFVVSPSECRITVGGDS